MITMRIKNISVVILSALACISCDKEILPQVSDGAIDFDVKASNIKVVEMIENIKKNLNDTNMFFTVLVVSSSFLFHNYCF